MRCIIVTGMSGAGKSTALNVLEDAGYYCVDNIPIPLIDKFIELAENSQDGISRFALGVDIRSGRSLPDLEPILASLSARGFPYEILFLEAKDDVLVKRFKETRRSHPLARDGRIESGVEKEREKLAFLKARADHIIDSSQLRTWEFKQELERVFVQSEMPRKLMITVLSFGFKFGIPDDADLVFDVRFLPNPYYVDELRDQTGRDAPVQEYIYQGGVAEDFLSRLLSLLRFLMPHYIDEGKSQLVIAVGCTGGRHRSVAMAEAIHRELSNDPALGLRIEHRDMIHDAVRKQYGKEGR